MQPVWVLLNAIQNMKGGQPRRLVTPQAMGELLCRFSAIAANRAHLTLWHEGHSFLRQFAGVPRHVQPA
jgi:hypothetical protein